MIGRMCREGQQAKCVHAVIIADEKSKGDQAAFDIKEERSKEDCDMSRPFGRQDYAVFQKIKDQYHLPPAEFQELQYQARLGKVNQHTATFKQHHQQQEQERLAHISRPNNDVRAGESETMPVEIL